MNTEKELTVENISLTELIDVSILQRMQDTFSAMARMAALTTDENGIPVTVGTNFSEFCSEFCRKSPIGRKRCEQCDKMGAVMVIEAQKPVSYFCHANLVDFAAPIMLGNRMIGSFIGGQVLSEPPDLERMRQIAREIEVDEDAFVEAAKKTQIVPQAAIVRSTNFIYEFAGIISDMAYKEFRSRQLSQEAMQAATQKSDFLANMSHEIRTPMNAVLGMAELALREEMSPQAQQYVRQIRSSGKNLLVIINDILDFSKIESGKMNIVEVVYETLSLVNDISNIVNNRIGNKDIEFIVDLSPDIPHELFGDNIRIHQILINLLNNAVKFTKQGRVGLKLYSEPLDDGTVTLKAEVSDTGMGIKKEDMGKLFHSFQQVDSKRNRNVEGTGLGLAISQQLLRLMHGKISVESEYEKGTTFFVEIPQKVISETPIAETSGEKISVAMMIQNDYVRHQIKNDLERKNITYTDLSKGGSLDDVKDGFLIIDRTLFSGTVKSFVTENPDVGCIVIVPYDYPADINLPNVRFLKKPVYSVTLYSALGLSGEVGLGSSEKSDFVFTAPDAHILIVDDNPINLTVASGILEPLKMQVDTANGATETLEKVKSIKYDIIFMDHMMPDVDGIETTHIVRRMIAGYEDVPIIALTANAIGGTKEMFIREGMNDFVAKPIETKEIVAMVRKWLPADKIIPVGVDEIQPEEKQETIQIEGLNIENAIRLLGNEKLLMQVMREYYRSLDGRINGLSEMLENNDISNYTINVHSLKSTSRQIGADELGELAFQLEMAGKEGNTAFIREHHGELVEKVAEVKAILDGVFPDEVMEQKQSKPADSEAVASLLEEMSVALEEFDTLAIDEVVEKMSQYEYEGDVAELFSKLKSASEECDLDSCAAIIEQWKALL
ncbi:MAG: PocR ligand-binding domain-containing protein [Oscillospiraceae bacterium]